MATKKRAAASERERELLASADRMTAQPLPTYSEALNRLERAIEEGDKLEILVCRMELQYGRWIEDPKPALEILAGGGDG